MAANDVIVQVVFNSEGIERITADYVDLDLFSVRGKSIEQCFAPSGGRASWEGLIEEIQRAVQDHEARILFYFENASEALTERFIKCLETVTHEVTVVESDEATARIHFNNAIQQKNRRQYDNALQLFLKAANLWPLEEVPEKLLEEIQCEILDIEDRYEKADQDSKAWDCCEKAAGLGHCGAQWKLAEYLWSTAPAQDVKDRNRAVDWALKAANGGIAQAQRFLGDRYLEGDALEQNDEKAERWYRLAAKQGDEEAKQMLADFFSEEMRGLSLELRKLLRQAKKGDAAAQYQMAKRYLNGEGLSENKEIAFQLFRLAANQNHREAQFRLSTCYQNGWGVEKNTAQAIKWLAESAMQGYIEAQYTLAKGYYEGKAIPQDLKKAEEWALKAADAGDRAAMALLEQIRKSMVVSIKDLIDAAIIKSKSTLDVNRIIPNVFLSGRGDSDNTYEATDKGITTSWGGLITWIDFVIGELELKKEKKGLYSLYCRGNRFFYYCTYEQVQYEFWKELQQEIKEHWGRILEIPSNLTSMEECIDVALEKAGLGSKQKRKQYFTGNNEQNVFSSNRFKMRYTDLGIPSGAEVYLLHNATFLLNRPAGFALTNTGIIFTSAFGGYRNQSISWNDFVNCKIVPESIRSYNRATIYLDEEILSFDPPFLDYGEDRTHLFIFWKILQQLLIANRNNIPELEAKPNA